MTIRPYTGVSDGISKGKRKGTEAFVKHCELLSGRVLKNNGTWGVRTIRGSKNQLSVHATGRAMDLSWRGHSRYKAVEFVEFLVRNAAVLEIELIIDYFPSPHGRAYKCTRNHWLNYKSKTVSGAPNGDWFHIEISPKFADSPKAVHQAFKSLLS